MSNDPARSATALAYHERTKHHLKRFAAGPETLDWDAQPSPFRRFKGTPVVGLPLSADQISARWSELFLPGAVAAAPLDRASLGALLEISFAISAWKTSGPDRWAVRCNPSSGNLHPTEVYLLVQGVAGLADGLYHYAVDEHALELRAAKTSVDAESVAPQVLVGLSSVQWREAWKYGERAFRYCQLDVGHALGSLRYAAAALGWSARVAHERSTALVAEVLGLNRAPDFSGVEAEEPECLIELRAAGLARGPEPELAPWLSDASWYGHANRLDAYPMYRWPVIEEAARASVSEIAPAIPKPPTTQPALASRLAPALGASKSATALLRQRRSAQAFDRQASQTQHSFFRMLQALLRPGSAPEDTWQLPARVHPVLFVHRVDGVEPGAYALIRNARGRTALQSLFAGSGIWTKPEGCPDTIPLFQLVARDLSAALRAVCCGQELARACSFGVAFMAELELDVREDPASYRRLHQEAGLLGQILYLEAEVEGLRGTGIGCFFDDLCLEVLGTSNQRLRPIYHFVVGVPILDPRIQTEPPYPSHASSAPRT
ncbi:MAG TPA: SagB family peptide dehydrogenase [Polyangiaceae bacterium]